MEELDLKQQLHLLRQQIEALASLLEDTKLSLNRTTRHSYTQAASCEITPGAVFARRRA